MGVSKKFQCPYCGVGCGLTVDENKKIRGDKNHPANRGDICLKPVYLPKVLDKGRITRPLYRERKNQNFRPVSWEEAYEILAEKIASLRPNELYFYLSGQLTTEDIYVASKLIKGFLKTNNVDANSRLCMASAVVAYKMAFGSDGPPCSYEDIDDADTFLFVGSNAAIAHPVLFKRVLKRRYQTDDVMVITVDPVETETAKKSDVHIKIRAGTDTALFNGVLHLLHREGRLDYGFIEKYTEGFDELLKEVEKYTPERVAKICGITEAEIKLLADVFTNRDKVVSFWSMGLNQSTNGVMKNVALINLHLATGRLNGRGCPFSLTGQPNAMGGREVGYLTTGLPGYRDVRNEEDRRFMESFWGIQGISPENPPTITEAIDEILEGKIKFLWVVCTNPAVSLPNLNKVKKALEKVFLVVQDAYFTDTCNYANLILPAAQLGEKEGTMTASDRTVSLCERWSEPPGEAKPDWLIFTEFAQKLGCEKFFPYKSAREIFLEYREATKGRLCDLSEVDYTDLPYRWGSRWLYPDLRFPIPSGKARFVVSNFEPPEGGVGEFVLLTGRLKKQWHTFTRTGKSPELLKGEIPPFVLVNPKDAERLGIEEGKEIKIISAYGETTRVVRFANIKEGHLYTPFGYPWEYGEPTNVLLSDRVDPISKEPALKFEKVRIIPTVLNIMERFQASV